MNDTNILKILKNNIIFIVVFSVLLLLYIIYLCYQIYLDSKLVIKHPVTKCPDYWDIDEEDPDLCIAPEWVVFTNKCTTKGGREVNKCHDFSKDEDQCTFHSDHKTISWDSLESSNACKDRNI